MKRKYLLVACIIGICVIIISVGFLMIMTKTNDNLQLTSLPLDKQFTINSENLSELFIVDQGIANCTQGMMEGWGSTECPNFNKDDYMPAQ